jgi:hypothetical protein
MPIFKGVGERMKQRLRDLGYERPNGELRVADFCMDHRFVGTMFYDFLADRRTPVKDLERIAEALETSPAWLCFGIAPTLIEGNAEIARVVRTLASKRPRASNPEVKARATAGARRSDRALPGRPRRERRRQPVQAQALYNAAARRALCNMLRSSGPASMRPAA